MAKMAWIKIVKFERFGIRDLGVLSGAAGLRLRLRVKVI